MRKDRTAIIAYSGRKIKADFHHSFRSEEFARKFADDWLSKVRSVCEQKKKRREERKNAQNPLGLGGVMVCSRAYDQTNIDYYEVTAMVGKKSVEICAIAAQRDNAGGMGGNSVPRPGVLVGTAARYIVQPRGGIRISGVQFARRNEFTEVAGVKVFKPDAWTTYA